MTQEAFPPTAGAPPPETVTDEQGSPPGAKAKRAAQTAWVCFVVAMALFLVGVGAAMLFNSQYGFAVFGVAALLATVWGFVKGLRSATFNEAGSGLAVAAGLLGMFANLGLFLLGAFATFISIVGFRRGRQLRSFGRILLPPVTSGAEWTKLSLAASADDSLRGPLAAQWRENGRTEHASVAAFARLTLDLMALGAPPSLIAAANRDSLDEIRHTELCFSLARSLDGRAESPGPFPAAQKARTLPAQRTLALGALAVDSLVDGALHEGVSARVLARLAKRCEEPTIKTMLEEIAADEGRHSAHGWEVVEWCLAEGGAPVAEALHGALRTLPRTMTSPLPEGAAAGGWERFGIHGHALEAEEFQKARRYLVERVGRLTTPRLAAAA